MVNARTAPRERRRILAQPAASYLALGVGVICISFTAILTKWAAAPGPVAAAYRMTTAAVVLTVPFIRGAPQQKLLDGWRLRWGLLGGLWFALNLGLLNSALLLTSAATATLLDNTAPIWVGIGAMILFHERLRARYWVGLGMALAGAAVVTGFNPLTGLDLNPGDLLAFFGAIFYAGYLLVTQRARRDLNSLSYLWLMAVTAAVLLWITSLAMGFPLTGYSWQAYAALVAVGLLSQTGGWLLINHALGYVPASAAVIVLLTQPVITGLLAVPLLGEPLTLRQMVGGALELMGVYLCLSRAAPRGALIPDPGTVATEG